MSSKAERSYIQAGILAEPPSRADGRSLYDLRSIALETGIAPLANGSARLSIGRGTEILAAVKLEVEATDVPGRIACSVACSPAAYPALSAPALDDLQHDYTTILSTTLTHPSLHPKNLGILQGAKAWLLNLDLVVLADAGNVHDAMFMAARAALWDTKVPRTKSVEFKARKSATKPSDMDVDSGFDTRQAVDFELPDYWDEGEVLDGRHRWPVCVTLNLVPPAHFLDATTQEEAATPLRLLLMFAFDPPESPSSTSKSQMQGMRTLGSGELTSAQISELIKHGEKYARDIWTALYIKLKDETASKLKEKTKF